MKILRRCLKAFGYLLLGLAMLALVGLAWLTVANWEDDPLSEAARQAIKYTPPTEQELQDNGYLILLGLDAPDQGDPVASALALGHKRLAREIERRQWVEMHGNETEGMPAAIQSTGDGIAIMPFRCPMDGTDCFAFYQAHQSDIAPLIEAHQTMLVRYAAMAHAERFSNPSPFYLFYEFPPFAQLVRVHELLLAQAALQWMSGEPEMALRNFQATARLRWHMTNSADNLVTAMITLTMHYRELHWLSHAIAHLAPGAPDTVSATMAELLRTPISLQQMFEGEKQLAGSSFYAEKYIRKNLALFPQWDEERNWWDESHQWWQALTNKIFNIAFLPQQTINRSIEDFQRLQAISALPADQISAAFEAYDQEDVHNNACEPPWLPLRNAIGRCTSAVAIPTYQRYLQRIIDIDGYRRLVLLQLQAATNKVAPANMPAWLAQSPTALRNPYNLQPMQWDGATASLVFAGKEQQPQNPDNSSTYRIALFRPTQP